MSSITQDRVLVMEQILKNMVTKSFKQAEENETTESEENYNTYKRAVLGKIRIHECKFTAYELGRVLGLSKAKALPIIEDSMNALDLLTEEQRKKLIAYKSKEIISNYEEQNNYYRMLMGLPEYNTGDKYYVYPSGSSKPIHEMTPNEIQVLKNSGEMDVIIGNRENEHYDYLKYIGLNIDIWQARESGLFEILHLNNSEIAIKYRKYYNQERKVFLRTYSSTYLNENVEYNEIYELNYLKFMALSVMELRAYSPTLDKDQYTPEEAEDKWEEVGLEYPKDLPPGYRNSITFLLNYLLLYKGTNWIMEFITEKLFTGLNLYKYYITKKPKPGIEYPVDKEKYPNPWDLFDVEFVLVPFREFYTENVYDEARKVYTYDEVVARDPKWRDTLALKRAVFSEDFSFIESKYLGMEFYVDLHRFSSDLSVMINIILNHREQLDVPHFYYSPTGTNESFFNLFIYFLGLFGFMLEKHNVVDPNTMEYYRYERLYGFNVPDNFEEFRVQFLKWFYNTEYRYIMNDFPDAIYDNDSFFDLIEKMEEQVSFVENFDRIVFSCTSIRQYEFFNQLQRLVLLVKANPKVMRLDDQTIDGLSYMEYLSTFSPFLYGRFMFIAKMDNEAEFATEFDNIIQTLISAMGMDGKDSKLASLLSDSSIFVQGVSKYLMYILKLFKAYSTDFMTEEPDYDIAGDYNYGMQIDQIDFDVDIEIEYMYHNDTQLDKITFIEPKPEHNTRSKTFDQIIYHTPYGDVELETK